MSGKRDASPDPLPNLIPEFGTSEPTPIPIVLAAGPLSLEIVNGVARGLRWRGVEIVRAIDCPIRDEAWATYPPQSAEETVHHDHQGFRFERIYAVAGGALGCSIRFEGTSDGLFKASAELTAHADFRTNRAGFTVLHPIAELPGSPVTVLRPDGSNVQAEFPRTISPAQPVLNIAGLVYSVRGVEARIVFSGETFEMEDQRNWTDASYKTYCRSLFRPFPYVIGAGEKVRQTIEIRLSGAPKSALEKAAGSAVGGFFGVRFRPSAERLPLVGLVLDKTSIPDAREAETVRLTGANVLRVRVDPASAAATLSAASALASERTGVELEIVVPASRPLEGCLREISALCSGSPLNIRRVIALPEAYLKNFQPTDPKPPGPTPRDAAAAARTHFPGARIGGGVLTHFTEFNRCRPDMSVCDYATHGTCAILHAADDRSVIESLEGLSHVFASGRALAGEREYHTGLVSIAMRTNPHGEEVAPNPSQVRIAAAGIDPRQRGLFGAAWAVGAMAATEGKLISSLALAAPAGALGIVYRKAAWPQPIFDEGGGAVYPLFHAVRALSRIGGAARLSIEGLPPGVTGVAGAVGSTLHLVLANLAGESRDVTLDPRSTARCLDRASFAGAIADPEWLRPGKPVPYGRLELSPFAVAAIEIPAAPR